MKASEQIELWSLLSKALDYRSFMQSYITWKKSHKKSYGYASLARAAGFAARSYPRDVILGKRDITAASITRFSKAMNLSGEAARCFHILVCQDRPELFDSSLGDSIKSSLAKSKAKLAQYIENRNQSSVRIYHQNSWPLVYASLGTVDEGASLEDVCHRTRFPSYTCRQILKEMIVQELVSFDSEKRRYFAKNSHLMYQNLGGNSGFKNFYLNSLHRAEVKSRKDFLRKDRLFFASAISVKKSQVIKYRTQLRDLLDSFAESVESPEGDEVVTILCGMY
ncbi:MAG: hypothetical protein JNL11_03615 [Bdellovibrionaceae bacterium]|nr:hypothetical protein [Pseudobdellovibrionaceae bacterium]